MSMNYDEVLAQQVAAGASDVHFKVGRPPLVRLDGKLKQLNMAPVTPADAEKMAKQFLSPMMYQKFATRLEADSSYPLRNVGRFRVNVFRQRGNTSFVLRVIKNRIPTLAELGLPPVVEKVLEAQRGLILVTGVTGSGKSSTLAAMVDSINTNREAHIITIEDPVEFLHRDKLSSINQREIGIDTESFSAAFVSSLRQDPDVIMVGELRDTVTMETALRAAETGHLVMSTLHTSDAKETIGRIIDLFPPEHQRQIRIQLSANLNAVISQRLMRRADGPGRVLASEIMIVNAAIREYIMEPTKMSEIRANMEKGKDQYGSQTFDQALLELLKNGVITEEVALLNATSPNDLKLKMTTGSETDDDGWM